MASTVDITGTRAGLASILSGLLLSLTAWIVYIAIFGALLFFAEESGHFLVTGIVAALLLAILFIVHRFIADRLTDDAHLDATARTELDRLPFDVVRHLHDCTTVSVSELLRASLASARGRFLLRQMAARSDVTWECLREKAESLDADVFLREAARRLPEFGKKMISAPYILYLLLEQTPLAAEFLNGLDLSLDDVHQMLKWEKFHELLPHRHSALSPHVLIRSFGGLEKSWMLGYTSALDALTREITGQILWNDDRVVTLHRSELDEALRIFDRPSNHNILVIGPQGIGKSAFVENVIYQMRRTEVKESKSTTRILVLRTAELLSGAARADAFLLQALKQAEKTGHFVLIVENLALLLESADPKVMTVLQRLLETKNISVVATARTEEYHDVVKRNAGLESLFTVLALTEPPDEEVLSVLMEHDFRLEHRLRVTVTYKALQAILTLSRRYLGRGAFPGKAIEVMTDAMAAARQAGIPAVIEPHIREIVSRKSHVNVTALKEGERDRLLQLEEIMHRQVIGQDAAVKAVSSALKRARLDVGAGKRPLGTFLFLGPTGVGKTQTAKTLAEVYFGAADRMIRLDMNEYATEQSMEGILGSPHAGREHAEGFLTKRIQDQPFSLILLDEIEKACKAVINLFLQVLDEGELTDHHGVKTDFRNTIIIATSNAGALFIRDYVSKHPVIDPEAFKKAVTDTILQEKIFSPEFLNRFDEVAVFHPLSRENVAKVARLELSQVIAEIEQKRGIIVKVEEALVEQIIVRGFSPEFGARALRRVITQEVEDSIAEEMLKRDIRRGETIVIGVKS